MYFKHTQFGLFQNPNLYLRQSNSLMSFCEKVFLGLPVGATITPDSDHSCFSIDIQEYFNLKYPKTKQSHPK